MQEKYPYIEWMKYVNALLSSPLTVDENEVIVVQRPDFLENLGKLLSATSPRVIANYLMWRVASYSSNYLTQELHQRMQAYENEISGTKGDAKRKNTCLDSLKEK